MALGTDTASINLREHMHDRLQLAGVTLRLAQGWGDASAVTATPVKQQACLTAALVEAVKQLGKGPIEQYPGLLPALLSGVSVRLESPLPPVRWAPPVPDH